MSCDPGARQSLSPGSAEAGALQSAQRLPLLAIRSPRFRKGAGVRNEAVFGSLALVRQAVCGGHVATSVAAFPGPLRSQLRFIRDPVSHIVPRTCLPEAWRGAAAGPSPLQTITN